MRIPQWFAFTWVIIFAVGAVGGSIFAYGFVRARAAELDEVLDLPALPQVSDLNPFGGDENAPPDRATPESAAEVAPVVTEAPLDAAPDATSDAETTPAPPEVADASLSADAPDAAASVADESDLANLEPWDDPRRVTILLMGIDQREGEAGPFPTDTMILLSLDPAGKTAAILSIPRDLWVEFPGLPDPGKINTAMIRGDNINYPGGGGPALAMKTVERNLGVKVQYYVVINFEVFTEVIDAIGSVEVCPEAPIDDDQYPDGSYGYITIHFDAGCQELGSERLLQYARTRHGDSDIDRSSRQQEVILATRDKVLSAGGVIALLPEVPSLWQSVQDNVRTNLTVQDIVRLAQAAEGISEENIRRGQITFDEVLLQQSPSGEDILVPIPTDIRLLVQDLFRAPGTPSQRAQPADATDATEPAQ